MENNEINAVRCKAALKAIAIADQIRKLNEFLDMHYDECFCFSNEDSMTRREFEDHIDKYRNLSGSFERTIESAISENKGE